MAREPLWPRLEPYIRAHQPPGYTAPRVEGENDQAHLYHSPLREDKHPSFVIWHDTPTKPGGYYDRATGEGGNLYELLQRFTAKEQPERNGRQGGQVQTMAEFCAERKLDPVVLADVYGVHEIVDEKSRRPALEYPTPLGVNRRKFLDGQKHKKYSWDPPGAGGTSHWYGLPQAAKIGGTTLFVVNGAPAVWSCHAAGVPAICYEGGEGKTPTAEDVQYLRGALDHWTSFRQLRVIYDIGEAHDRPGRGSRAVAAALRKGKIAATAYGLPESLGKGGDVDDLHRQVEGGLAEALLALDPLDGGGDEGERWFEWWNDIYLVDDPDVACVLDGLLAAESTSLFGAKPKVGKSVFARCLAYHVLKGLDFCGRKVRQGPVLYLSLEDRRRAVKKHFKQLGLLEQPGFALVFGRRPDNLVEKLERAAERHKFVLVIIDTLFKGLDFEKDNDYAEAKRRMEPVEHIARTYGPHIMMTHHLGKIERGGGDDFLGTTALFANVDTGLLMKKRDVGRTLQTIQRESELEDLEETLVTYDKETGHVAFGGTLSEVRTTGAKEAILRRVGDKQRTEDDIKAGIKMDAILISETLDAMVEVGELKRTGRGVRGHPYLFHNPRTYKEEPPPEPTDITAKREEKQAQQQKAAAERLVARRGGWEDMVKAWVSFGWGTPTTAHIYEQTAILGCFVWPDEMEVKGRQTVLGEELSRLAREGTLINGHRITDLGRKRNGHCWGLEKVDGDDGRAPQDDPPAGDGDTGKRASENQMSQVSHEGPPATGGPEGADGVTPGACDTSFGLSGSFYKRENEKQVSHGAGVTGPSDAQSTGAQGADGVTPGACDTCDTSFPLAHLLTSTEGGFEARSIAVGGAHLAAARDLVDQGVGPRLTQVVRDRYPTFSADPSWSDVYRIPLDQIPRPEDPATAPQRDPGAPVPYPVIVDPLAAEAALSGYSGLVGVDCEADGLPVWSPLLALQLTLYPEGQLPVTIVLHHSTMRDASGQVRVPEGITRHLQRPDIIPVWHGGGRYDGPILARHGCDLLQRPVIDTWTCERVLLCGQFPDEDEGEKNTKQYPKAGLGYCLLRRLGIWLPDKEEKQKGIAQRLRGPELSDEDLAYCVTDTLYLGALFSAQWAAADAKQRYAMRLEIETQQLMAGITARGLAVDTALVAAEHARYVAAQVEPQAKILQLLPNVKIVKRSGALSDAPPQPADEDDQQASHEHGWVPVPGAQHHDPVAREANALHRRRHGPRDIAPERRLLERLEIGPPDQRPGDDDGRDEHHEEGWPESAPGLPTVQFRIARPTNQLERVVAFYRDGFGLPVLYSYERDAGYDGVMFRLPGRDYHLEVTRHAGDGPCPPPSPDTLLVFYILDKAAITALVERLGAMGYAPVRPPNPYWAAHGVTIADPDGWHVVLMNTPGFGSAIV